MCRLYSVSYLQIEKVKIQAKKSDRTFMMIKSEFKKTDT